MCLGPSMLPTFNRSGDGADGAGISDDRWCRAGDVALAPLAGKPRHTVVMLGKEGDIIAVPKAGNFGGTLRVEVPRGHLWLQGDNANNSTTRRTTDPSLRSCSRARFSSQAPEVGWVKNESWRHMPVD